MAEWNMAEYFMCPVEERESPSGVGTLGSLCALRSFVNEHIGSNHVPCDCPAHTSGRLVLSSSYWRWRDKME